MFLNGRGIPEPDALGEAIVDDSFLLLFNPLPQTVTFTVPDDRYGNSWQIVIDTADPLLATPGSDAGVKPGDTIDAPVQTALVLQNLY